MLRNRLSAPGSAPPGSIEFDRTLSPSDPAPAVAPDRSGRVQSVAPEHGVERTSSPASLREKETVRDLDVEGEVPIAAVTPMVASEYVPPRPLPTASAHKTIETDLVQLDPEVHPRTAQTIMDARHRALPAVDPGQVPTKPMPIQVRRAARRRLLRAALAILCAGAGVLLVVLLQGASWGHGAANERAEVQSSRSVAGTLAPRATANEQPTLAIDVRAEQHHAKPAERRVQPRASDSTTPQKETEDPPPSAHLASPWADEPLASDPAHEQKSTKKRAVWLE